MAYTTPLLRNTSLILFLILGLQKEVLSSPLPPSGKIGNYVWHDINGNGIQDPGELGLSNVQVRLFDIGHNLIATTITNNSGFYLFQEVAPGLYFLQFSPPNNYRATEDHQGTSTLTDSNIDGSNGRGTTPFLDIQEGECELTIDAGFFKYSQVGNSVWMDDNYNSLRDSTEQGLNGIAVELWKLVNDSFELFNTQETKNAPNGNSEMGYYNFIVPPGSYQIKVPPKENAAIGAVYKDVSGVQPLTSSMESDIDSDINSQFLTDTFFVASGQEWLNIDAGFFPYSAIGNRVWMDENQNGIQDPEESGVANITVQAYSDDWEMMSERVTDSDGYYMIDDLATGNYFLKFGSINHHNYTYPYVGQDSMNSDVTEIYGPGTTAMMNIGIGETRMDIDAGLRLSIALSLDWLEIEVQKHSKYNELQWSVENSDDLAHFEIETKNSDIEDFQTIGSLKLNSSPAKFIYRDFDIRNKSHFYYRVKGVNADGTSSLSDIVSLKRDQLTPEMVLYPVPANDFVSIDLSSKERVELALYDLHGKRVKNIYNDTLSGSISIKLDLSTLSSGTYLLRGQIDDQWIIKKIVLN